MKTIKRFFLRKAHSNHSWMYRFPYPARKMIEAIGWKEGMTMQYRMVDATDKKEAHIVIERIKDETQKKEN